MDLLNITELLEYEIRKIADMRDIKFEKTLKKKINYMKF